jgi:S-adenosylmethionine synthetase
MARVACECYVTMGLLNVGGEITTTAMFDVAQVARDLGNDIGYTSPKYGFDVNTAAIVRTIHAQSPDISQGVTKEGGQIGVAGAANRDRIPAGYPGSMGPPQGPTGNV